MLLLLVYARRVLRIYIIYIYIVKTDLYIYITVYHIIIHIYMRGSYSAVHRAATAIIQPENTTRLYQKSYIFARYRPRSTINIIPMWIYII